MIQACKEIFPSFYEDNTLREMNFRHLPLDGRDSIPDLASPDESLAIECETLGKEKRERFRNHSKRYKETLLVIPLLENVNEIWMYNAGEFRKFRGFPEE